MKSPGGRELSLSACPGVGNRPPSKKKIANPRGCARGGMVTGRIEPCISQGLEAAVDGKRSLGPQVFKVLIALFLFDCFLLACFFCFCVFCCCCCCFFFLGFLCISPSKVKPDVR